MNVIQEIQAGVNGLHLPESEQAAAFELIRSQLWERVGIAITEKLTESDLAAFNEVVKQDDAQALELLDAKIPEFDSLVHHELEQLLQEYALLS